MIVKWISCSVPKKQQQAFSDAQADWKELAEVPGFVAQVGGWDLSKENRACVIGFWRNLKSHESFMKRNHDNFVDRHGRQPAYSTIDTRLFDSVFQMPVEQGNLNRLLQPIGLMHAVLCEVSPSCEEQFLDIQRHQLELGMRGAGMIGGLLSKQHGDGAKYVAITTWRDKPSHDIYPHNDFSTDIEKEIVSMDTAVIKLEQKWRVKASNS